MTIYEEAVQAFMFEHEFRCLEKKRGCRHFDLTDKMYRLQDLQVKYDEQKLLIKNLSSIWEDSREKVITQLDRTRQEWLDVQNLPDDSFAAWVDKVFAVAIKVMKEIE
jgi:hypothetical protein